MNKPNASKVVTLLVSVGPDDTRSMGEFADVLKKVVRGNLAYDPLATVVGTEYQHDGKRYRVPDWDEWDGDPKALPRDVYSPPSAREAVAEMSVPEHKMKSPREALEGIVRRPSRHQHYVFKNNTAFVRKGGWTSGKW